MGRYNDVSWSTIGLIMCLLFSLFLPGGISGVVEENKEYDLPVYISEKVTVSGYTSYTVSGELTNRTNEDVIIDCLVITITGKKEYTSYSGGVSIRNITVPANSSYKINSSGHKFKTEHGGTVPSGELDFAQISDCIINGEHVELKKFDGENFIDQGMRPGANIIAIVIGSIALLGAIAIIWYKIKERYY